MHFRPDASTDAGAKRVSAADTAADDDVRADHEQAVCLVHAIAAPVAGADTRADGRRRARGRVEPV